jgi:nitrite reductase/ring-hydroxylating ferredoxin subunit
MLRERLRQSAAGAPLEQATTLPPECYISTEVFDEERERIFGRCWIPVARIEDLVAAGDFVTIDIAGDPIVVTRGRDGDLHALANVCRHRNTTIVEGTGNVPSLQCPYHRWTYRLDGQLLAAPNMDGIDDFTAEDVCLPQLAVETWHGWVFVNLDANAAPLAPQLAGLEVICAPYDLAAMKRVGVLHYHQTWNWKITLENFAESYHHAGTHGATLQPIYPGERSWAEPNGGEPWMSLDHVSLDASQEPFTASTVFPMHLFSIVRPFGLVWFRLEVHDVEDVDLELQAFVAPEYVGDDAVAQLFVEGLRAINDEDVIVNRRTGRGLHSRFAEPGRLSRLEEGCRQFRAWWLAQMTA